MKSSPLLLKWVAYPAASYVCSEEFESKPEDAPCQVDLKATVTWDLDGEHMAYLDLKCRDSEAVSPYQFSLSVAATFSVDVEVAKREYNQTAQVNLPKLMAVNVCRILYSGAREYIAMLTARAPYGSAQLESILLEPDDIRIGSQVEPSLILRNVFQVPENEILAMEARVKAALKKKSAVSKKQ